MRGPVPAALTILFFSSLRRYLGRPAILGVGPAEARRLQQEEGAILVDVREAHEWRAGHAPQARHIPLRELEGKVTQLPKDKTLIVACASGMRSQTASRRLVKAGFPRVLNLRGGMSAWRNARLPMQK